MGRFLAEVRRRKVLQTFLPYIGFVWLWLQVVSVVTPMLRLSPMIDTFFAVLLFAGVPVMLYLSWYFDFTAGGLKRTPDADTGEVSPPGLLSLGGFAIVMASSVYAGYVYYMKVDTEYAKSLEGIEQERQARSIAVLPFEDLSPEQAQDYLAYGLSEEVANLLGSYSALQVASASAARRLFEEGLDPVTIARRLKVDTVLAGTVRKQGSSLRLFAELIDAATTRVLWSESYSRNFVDVFTLESEIARATSNSLIDTFLAADEVSNPLSTKSADAYVLYLKGRQAYNRQTTDSIKEARRFFEQAVALDPEYSQAYVALADTIALSADGSRNFGILKPEIAKMLAEEHLGRALVRNPELAEAHAVQGRVFDLAGARDDALAAFDKAIAINPSLAKAHMWKYVLLRDMGREENAFETLKTARVLDPESITLVYNYGIELDRRGRFDEAEAVFRKLIAEHPDLPMGYAGLAGTFFSLGDLSASIDYWQQAYALSPDNDDYFHAYLSILLNLGLTETVRSQTSDPAYLPSILWSEGQTVALAEEMQLRVDAYPDDPWTAFEAAWFFMLLGEDQRALALLEQTDRMMTPEEKFSMPSCSPAVEIAWAYRLHERTDEADEILRTCQRRLTRLSASGIRRHEQRYLQLRLDALQGNRSAAQDLRDLVSAGYLESWIVEDPLLETIRDHPQFSNARALLQERLAAERQEALALLESQPASEARESGE